MIWDLKDFLIYPSTNEQQAGKTSKPETGFP